MQWHLLKTNKPLRALAIASLAIFPSLFMGPKIMGIVFLFYVLILAWAVSSLMGRDIFSRVSDAAWEKGEDAAKEKRYDKAGVYFIAVPMMFVGMITVGFLIFGMLFIL